MTCMLHFTNYNQLVIHILVVITGVKVRSAGVLLSEFD